MKKCAIIFGKLVLFSVLFFCGTLLADRQQLNREVICLEVNAASDRPSDRMAAHQVQELVKRFLEPAMTSVQDGADAREYLNRILPELEEKINLQLGKSRRSYGVVLQWDSGFWFGQEGKARNLPAGTYDTLRIYLGEGRGNSCGQVLYLCPEVGEVAGPEQRLRFELLNFLGHLENLLPAG